MLHLKTPEEIDLLRKAGRVVADILDHIGTVVRPGVSTGELDRIADEHISACGGTAAFKGYRMTSRMPPFPGIVCASINDETVAVGKNSGRLLSLFRGGIIWRLPPEVGF